MSTELAKPSYAIGSVENATSPFGSGTDTNTFSLGESGGAPCIVVDDKSTLPDDAYDLLETHAQAGILT